MKMSALLALLLGATAVAIQPPSDRVDDGRRSSSAGRSPAAPPNILFVVLDDTGIDTASWQPFGWNLAPDAPYMPVMQGIADDAISFTNFWATPECSPTRAAFLTGRLGHRTGVTTAIVDPMLAANNLNAAEVTLPTLLRDAGYSVGMFGKYHLAGDPPNTPPGHGYEAPSTTAGLDRYEGYWSLPPAIDESVGGQGDGTDAACGFPLGSPRSRGAACFPSGSCNEAGGISWGDCQTDLDPLEALALGGLPLLDDDGNLATECGDCERIQVCDLDTGTYLEQFFNAYYAWPELVVDETGGTTQGYPVVDATRRHITDWSNERAAEWIRQQTSGGDPWMCFLTHSAAHTPIQPPPAVPGQAPLTQLDCSLPTEDPTVQYRPIFTRMMEQLDESLGRMLVDLGYASIEADGGFRLADLEALNLQLVVLADNGSYGFTVFPPFDPGRAKQTVYQTGVWVPCMIAGAGVVVEPGSRTRVAHPVNVVDLFQLFANSAGIDAYAEVERRAPGRVLDARPMSPYLLDPSRESLRQFDVTLYQGGMYGAEVGSEEWVQGGVAGGCLLNTQYVDQLISAQSLCTANGGVWFGDRGFCEQYATWQDDACSPELEGMDFSSPIDGDCTDACRGDSICVQAPTRGQWAIRLGRYKLVVLQYPSCLPEELQCRLEFFHLPAPMPPSHPGIDREANQLDLEELDPPAAAAFEAMRNELLRVLEDQPFCPGDGNLDGRIDQLDLEGAFADWGAPSWWDVDRDGTVDGADIGLLIANWNPDCRVNQVPRGTATFNQPGHIPDCLIPD